MKVQEIIDKLCNHEISKTDAIEQITKAVWNEFTAKTHNEKRDYQYSVNDLRNVITEAYKNAEALQLQQTGVSTCFLEDVTDDVFNMGYKQVSCCKIAPITNENYCPNCGKKILK